MRNERLAAAALCIVGLFSAPLFQACSSTQPASEQMSDAAITSKINAKYLGDSSVKGRDIKVTTEEGVVYLTGRVGTQAEKDEAEQIARNTKGVRSVVNNIMVGDRT
jgi:hyperosmotically inducible periplasmic protein